MGRSVVTSIRCDKCGESRTEFYSDPTNTFGTGYSSCETPMGYEYNAQTQQWVCDECNGIHQEEE